jgi:hypothetical protein
VVDEFRAKTHHRDTENTELHREISEDFFAKPQAELCREVNGKLEVVCEALTNHQTTYLGEMERL